MKTDKLFYRLFRTCPQLAFELAGLPPPAVAYHQRSLEVKETAFRLDGLMEPCVPGFPALFWEAQLYPDPDFYPRWFTSILLTLSHYPQPHWQGLVIYPDRATECPPPQELQGMLEHGPFHRVYLEDLLDRPGLSWSLGLLRLLIIKDSEVPHTARQLAEQLDQRPAELVKSQAIELLETFLAYKLPKLTLQGVQAMLHLPPDTRLEDTAFYQDVMNIGVRKGELRGELIGEKKAGNTLVSRLLQRRFGAQVASYQTQIGQLNFEQLAQLGEDLLDFQGIEDLKQWLVRH